MSGSVAIQAELSVVVVSFNGVSLLSHCLDSLINCNDDLVDEIHVVYKGDMTIVRERYSTVSKISWHSVSTVATIPKMRTVGINACRKEYVALIEDDCAVSEHWARTIKSLHEAGNMVIGGSIEPGSFLRGLDWGIFICEFGRYLKPYTGEVRSLPGNNVSYRRSVLPPSLDSVGFYEIPVHDMWIDSGNILLASNEMQIHIDKRWSYSNCIADPFFHGRAYAYLRFPSEERYKKLLYGILSVSLPFVKTLRSVRDVKRRNRIDIPLVRALPWIVLFHTSWALGECAGYLTGPGNSREKWK